MRTPRLFRPGARRAGLLAVTAACGLAVVPASAAAVTGHTAAGAAPAGDSPPPARSVSAVTAAHGTARPLILIKR